MANNFRTIFYFFTFFFSNLQEQFIKCISHIDVQKNLARVVRVRVVRVVRVFRVVRAQKLLLVHHRVARARRTSNTRSSRVSSTRITREYRVEYIYSLRFDKQTHRKVNTDRQTPKSEDGHCKKLPRTDTPKSEHGQTDTQK